MSVVVFVVIISVVWYSIVIYQGWAIEQSFYKNINRSVYVGGHVNILPEWLIKFPSIYKYGRRISALQINSYEEDGYVLNNEMYDISSLKHLIVLEVYADSVDGMLANINTKSKLKKLCVYAKSISRADCGGISKISNRIELQLSHQCAIRLLSNMESISMKISTLVLEVEGFDSEMAKACNQIDIDEQVVLIFLSMNNQDAINASSVNQLKSILIRSCSLVELRRGLASGRGAVDMHISKIGEIKQVENIYLNGVRLSADTWSSISKLPYLKTLYSVSAIGNDRTISDDDMEHVSKLPALSRLAIADSLLTDKVLELLKKMDKLQYICIVRSKMTPAGIAEYEEYRREVNVPGKEFTVDLLGSLL